MFKTSRFVCLIPTLLVTEFLQFGLQMIFFCYNLSPRDLHEIHNIVTDVFPLKIKLFFYSFLKNVCLRPWPGPILEMSGPGFPHYFLRTQSLSSEILLHYIIFILINRNEIKIDWKVTKLTNNYYRKNL